MAEDTLRRNLDRAFVPPANFPDRLLLSRTMAAIAADVPARVRNRFPRLSPRLVAAAIVLVVAGAAFVVPSLLRRTPPAATSHTPPVLFPTKMITKTIGWAVTETGGRTPHVWRTTDGGSTWVDTALPAIGGPQPVFTHTDSFPDGTDALITETLGGAADTRDYSIVTLRTRDGGKTWQQGSPIALAAGVQDTTQFFLDARSGWLVNHTTNGLVGDWPDVYTTVDGGIHWTLVASKAGIGTGPADLTPGWAQPTFVSASTGWLTIGLFRTTADSSFLAHAILLVTRDGGRTWHQQKLPVVPADATSYDAPVFFDQLHGYLVLRQPYTGPAAHPVLITTSDGGRTWNARTLAWDYLWSIEFVDAKHGWAIAGPSATFMKQKNDAPANIPLPLYRTDDGGITWTSASSNLAFMSGRNRLNEIHFIDQSTGFATIWGDNGPVEFLRTTDGGRTWSTVTACSKQVGLAYPPPPC